MKKLCVLVLSVMSASSLCGMAVAGSIDSPGLPSSGSGMYTLSQTYDYLNSGIDVTLVPAFQEPGAAPGSTMKTMKQIYEDIKAKFAQCSATAADSVESGKSFFCTKPGSWGVQTGTAYIPPTPTPTITPTPTPTITPTWLLNETNCNATTGWHWYTTNDRSACWSKTLADYVPWNKEVANDSDNPGAYTCATGYTLQQRMAAAAAGEWYKIVASVGTHTMATGGNENGQNGAQWISALAIADCVDGSRDLCTGDNCLGGSWTAINSALRTWAGAIGKSALPYLGNDAGTINDYATACASSTNDLPLACATPNAFYLNRKVCGDGNNNYSWAAASGGAGGEDQACCARLLGSDSCSTQADNDTNTANDGTSFRVVVRP
ncbi:MAG: hypothetical protein NTZ78_11400 [Candidatus Aureabacteria bacterium]|nr:hypothetical protein [Candidatus Auribacterota bacterium]